MKKNAFLGISIAICAAFAYFSTSCSGPVHTHELEEVIVKQPTCTEPGSAYVRCKDGDFKSAVRILPAFGHEYHTQTILPTCLEEGYDIRYCIYCGDVAERSNIVPALGHDFHVHTIEATCTHAGHIESYCSRCGVDEYDPREIAQKEHNYVLDHWIEPTCELDGYEVLKCEDCGKEILGQRKEKLGHNYVFDHNEEPSCDHIGHEILACTRCGKERQGMHIDRTPHQFKLDHIVEATCIDEGFEVLKCAVCGEKVMGETFAPLGHDLHHVHHDPNCTESGLDVDACSRCDYEENRVVLAPLGHDLVHHEGKDATCTEEGFADYDSCTRCDYSTYCHQNPLGHHFVEYLHPATCTEPGYTESICSYCGQKTSRAPIAALGHDLIHVEGKPATCDHEGHEAYDYCSRCDYSTYQRIAPLNQEHRYVETTIEPTTSHDGYTLHTCEICGDSYKDHYVPAIEPFRNYDSEKASSAGLYNGSKVISHRDDDFYYFMLYQGHVEDYLLHDFVGFTYDDSMARFSSYPKAIRAAKPMDVLDTFERNKVILNKDVASTLCVQIGFGDKANMNILYDADNIINNPIVDLIQPTSIRPLELTDANLNALTRSINALTSSYVPGENLAQYTSGVSYSYQASASADLYVGVGYDIKNNTLYYRNYTVLSGLTERLFASHESGAPMARESIPVASAASARLLKPSSYQTNHPLRSTSAEWDITNGGVGHSILNMGSYGYRLKINNFDELYDGGYDMVKIEASWGFHSGGWSLIWDHRSNVEFEITDYDVTSSFQNFGEFSETGVIHHCSVYKVASLLSGGKGVGLHFVTRGTYAIDVYDVRVKVTFFNTNAAKEGAYAGTNVADYR